MRYIVVTKRRRKLRRLQGVTGGDWKSIGKRSYNLLYKRNIKNRDGPPLKRRDKPWGRPASISQAQTEQCTLQKNGRGHLQLLSGEESRLPKEKSRRDFLEQSHQGVIHDCNNKRPSAHVPWRNRLFKSHMWSMGPEPCPRSSMAERAPKRYSFASPTAASKDRPLARPAAMALERVQP